MEQWSRSTRCGSTDTQNDCVEVRQGPEYVEVRDSKRGAGSPVWQLRHDDWDVLTKSFKEATPRQLEDGFRVNLPSGDVFTAEPIVGGLVWRTKHQKGALRFTDDEIRAFVGVPGEPGGLHGGQWSIPA